MVAVQRPYSGSLSKPRRGVTLRLGAPAGRVLLAGFLPAAWVLAGCGSAGDLISSVALPSQQASGYAEGVDVGAPDAGPHAGTVALTPAQRGYLDALGAEGVHPSSELRALSIGSYVCQARAAGQGDQAVWDLVAPMVRSDVADAHAASPRPSADPDANAVVGNYIRIATQRLC